MYCFRRRQAAFRFALGTLPAVAVLLASANCATGTDTEDVTIAADGGDTKIIDSDGGKSEPPHALGTINLAETHTSAASTPTPIVTATFIPDAAKVLDCKKAIDDSTCELVVAPKCGTTACASTEVCAFDKNCTPKCQKKPVCSTTCETDEVCTVDDSGDAACAKIETFDAGPLSFSGTTTGIALFPPYLYDASGSGAPFLPGAQIKVVAQGAAEAGFEKFEESFAATSFIQTKPKLDKLLADDVFGTSSVPISWVPGSDSILVRMTGLGGTVTCTGKDSEGTLDLPRKAIDAALGDSTTSTPTLALSISRQRKETKKGHKTKGTLASTTVQSEAWIDLVTTSTETATIR